jgi:bacteriocin-like protein
MVGVKITDENRDVIIHRHAQKMVDEMDYGTLMVVARDSIENNLSELTNKELQKIIGEYNPQILENAND